MVHPENIWLCSQGIPDKLCAVQILTTHIHCGYLGIVISFIIIDTFISITATRVDCYFVDIFYDGDFDEQEVIDFFNYELPYNQKTSNIEVRNRDINSFNMVPYNKDCDFGPHIMLDLEATIDPNMEIFFDFLENLVSKINMDPISRATVLKSSFALAKSFSSE